MTESNSPSQDITFETFILSVGTAAMMALGEIENPISKKKEVDLSGAKQNIAILELLSEKTQGNLSERENKMLAGIIAESRLKFVEKSNTPS